MELRYFLDENNEDRTVGSAEQDKELSTTEELAVKLESVQEGEVKKTRDDAFQDLISGMVDYAEKKTRNYELAIKRGDFTTECPYSEIIEINKHITKLLLKQGWRQQIETFSEQIDLFESKLEKDKKLREIEANKLEKQKEYENFKKIQETDQMMAVIESLDLEEKILNLEEQKERENKKAEEIFNIIKDAEQIAKSYENEIKLGKILDYNSPYDSIIEIYMVAKEKFENIGWEEEANNLINSLNFYLDKKKRDIKLREIEEKKQGLS